MHYGIFPSLTGTPAALREELAGMDLSTIEVVAMTLGHSLGKRRSLQVKDESHMANF